jgi:hypothetical protein
MKDNEQPSLMWTGPAMLIAPDSAHVRFRPTGRRWACRLFAAKGAKWRSPAYTHLVDMEQDGERLTLWFGHMAVKIVGKGLEPLVEGLRRQVVYYIRRSMCRMLRPGAKRIGSDVSRLGRRRSRRRWGDGRGKNVAFRILPHVMEQIPGDARWQING